MADNKSSEEFNEAMKVLADATSEYDAYEHNGVRLSDSEEPGGLRIKVDVDVSDALKGLKAVQREARKATAALKELEGQQKIVGVSNE